MGEKVYEASVSFDSDDSEKLFIELSDDERKEFNSDLCGMMRGMINLMYETGMASASAVASQRLGKRYFDAEFTILNHAYKEPSIKINRFEELSLDEYIDLLRERDGEFND